LLEVQGENGDIIQITTLKPVLILEYMYAGPFLPYDKRVSDFYKNYERTLPMKNPNTRSFWSKEQ